MAIFADVQNIRDGCFLPQFIYDQKCLGLFQLDIHNHKESPLGVEELFYIEIMLWIYHGLKYRRKLIHCALLNKFIIKELPINYQ